MVSQHNIGGKNVFLIQPQHFGSKFNQENKILRSSVWDSDGYPVSLGYPKFKNWGEDPENFPVPSSLKGCSLVAKIDGSLLMSSVYRDNLVVRTRGTVDATELDNGFEIELLKEKYPSFFRPEEGVTYLAEWVSPINKIVIDYGPEPDLYLIGIVNHTDYSLMTQVKLDEKANSLGLKRPKYYNFDDVKDMLESVTALKGEEGVCCYSKDGQNIWKVKASEYLVKHRFKENATLEATIDLFCEFEYPTYQEFEKFLIEKFDYECFQMVQGFASRVCSAKKEVDLIIEKMKQYIVSIQILSSRKEQAERIISSYGNTNRAGFVFHLLDGKILGKEAIKKLLWQVLKK